MKSIKKFFHNFWFPLAVFSIWRTVITVFSLIAPNILPFKQSFPYVKEILMATNFPDWVWKWGNFDGVHYLYLSLHSYSADGLHVFFPMYPIFTKIVGMIIGNYFIGGLLVSNILFLVSLILLFDLVRKITNSMTAAWTITFLAFFPTSFFFGALYSESLFLFLLLLSLTSSGVLGIVSSYLLGATRLIGSLILPSSIFERKNFSKGLAAVAGLVSYMIFLGVAYHKPLGFLTSQSLFKNARASSLGSLVTPPQVVWRYIKIFLTADPGGPSFQLAGLEFFAFFFAVIVLVYATFKTKIPRSWLVFSWLAILLPTFSGTFSSMPRYILVAFPIFLVLAQIKNVLVKSLLLMLSLTGLAVLTSLFIQGYFIS